MPICTSVSRAFGSVICQSSRPITRGRGSSQIRYPAMTASPASAIARLSHGGN